MLYETTLHGIRIYRICVLLFIYLNIARVWKTRLENISDLRCIIF